MKATDSNALIVRGAMSPPAVAKILSAVPGKLQFFRGITNSDTSRLRKQIEFTADLVLKDLMDEVSGYPKSESRPPETGPEQVVHVPLRIRTSLGVLSFMSTTTVFGTPVDVRLSERAIEMFSPADQQTAEAVRRAAR